MKTGGTTAFEHPVQGVNGVPSHSHETNSFWVFVVPKHLNHTEKSLQCIGETFKAQIPANIVLPIKWITRGYQLVMDPVLGCHKFYGSLAGFGA